MLDRKRRTPICPIVLDAAWQQYINQLEHKHVRDEWLRRHPVDVQANEDAQYDCNQAAAEGWGNQIYPGRE
jgi:hypothetical protein